MKKLFSLLLIAVIATACKTEKPTEEEPHIVGSVVEMQYAMQAATPTGENLFDNTKLNNSINTQRMRLKHFNTKNELVTYLYDDYPRSFKTGTRVYGYDYTAGSNVVGFEIIPQNPYNYLADIPKGYSTITNYIDWPNGVSDKVEATILRFGNVVRVVKLVINDSFVWQKENEQHCTTMPIIKKVIDGDNVSFEKVNIW